MKVKAIHEKISCTEEKFCDLTTCTGNFVLANSNTVIHNSHIAVLLLTVFLKLVPKLIESGVIYIANMPLYGGMVGKKFIPLYSDHELEQFKLNNPKIKIQRYKGLGEMNPDQLEVCLLDINYRKLIPVTLPEDKNDIFQLMTSSELKRKLV